MPSNFIAVRESYRYPHHPRINFEEVCRSVFDRYYHVYIARLQNSGYVFPPPNRYREQFGTHLPASFICSKEEGSFFDPGQQFRYLVFLYDENASDVRVFIARYHVQRRGEVDLFGEGAYGINVRLLRGVTVVVVAVPTLEVDSITSEGVIRL